ncbi:MAG: LPS export ABC transporter periplasmic protein LptC [Nitrosomonadales bacterium]|jgi:lipopolysaccharide export system protein LptC|nr:LPS export ABC transporter periplasmic protein LptC [Nitrosomonadales bacterium]MBT4759348.1 LPS export ABC transporter periplasmic protein LptC [Nitrosomonadales bacterium]MBT5150583.1 LPS export ABC transporter periplasmic protein LptC [Nitrosomonadales bacterium]MBT6014489.1 LPS export ABC transporter periplasmic protein LptC [Nitrosomonadales bacterium]MBT6251563.1 LPS export ABC transporter periplasmic protein LptC [Nitrosomonadales bacterium]
MNLLSTAFALIFIIIVMLASFWLKEEVVKEYKNSTTTKNSGPSFFLNKFNSTRTDEDGNLQNSLQAEYMKHYKDQDKTTLIKPFYTKYKNKNKHSTIYSDVGEVRDKGEEIILRENAILVRLPTKTKKVLKLFTHELNIYSELDVVTSQKAVKMIQEPNIEINGIGMKYDNKEGILKLLSKVKVHYEKPKDDNRFKY